jgi:hypothetical protein
MPLPSADGMPPAGAVSGTPLAKPVGMKNRATLIGSVVLAGTVGLLLFLRPRPTAHESLPEPASLPPAARQVIKSKMGRHDTQMRQLVSSVIVLDDNAVARIAGEIFDEPALARPVAGDELNGLLPERFFVLQDDLRSRARALVIATQQRDRAKLADEFAALTKSCVSCHDVYLNAPGGAGAGR